MQYNQSIFDRGISAKGEYLLIEYWVNPSPYPPLEETLTIVYSSFVLANEGRGGQNLEPYGGSTGLAGDSQRGSVGWI